MIMCLRILIKEIVMIKKKDYGEDSNQLINYMFYRNDYQ